MDHVVQRAVGSRAPPQSISMASQAPSHLPKAPQGGHCSPASFQPLSSEWPQGHRNPLASCHGSPPPSLGFYTCSWPVLPSLLAVPPTCQLLQVTWSQLKGFPVALATDTVTTPAAAVHSTHVGHSSCFLGFSAALSECRCCMWRVLLCPRGSLLGALVGSPLETLGEGANERAVPGPMVESSSTHTPGARDADTRGSVTRCCV